MKKILLTLIILVTAAANVHSQCSIRPIINNFSPNTGFIGSTVTITGANFDATTITNNVVFFGATQATVQSATFGSLVVTVPVGASTARIAVTNQCNLTAYSSAPFNGIFCPTPLNTTTYNNTDFTLSSTGAYNMLAVDLDGDGRSEVVSSGQGEAMTVARNTSVPGSMSFVEHTFSGRGGGSIYTADFDGDGRQDLVSRNNISRNTSTGPGNISFAPVVSANTVSNYQIAAGDFNNDGKIDIVGENSNVIYLALNTSTGPGNISFGPRQTIQNVGNRCRGIMVADLDGDGKDDIMGTQFGLDRAVTLRNTTPDGSTTFSFETFETWPTNGDGPYRCQVADFNKDGKMDLTTCNYYAPANTAVFINNSTVGDISFNTTINLPAPTSNYRIQVGDVDGDGYADIVTKSNTINVFSVYRNTTTTTSNTSFAPRIDYNSSDRAEVSGLAIGDFDGDFVPDIATSGTGSRTIRFHRNTSSQVDNTPPTAICQNVNVGLSPSGSVTVTPAQVDNGSSDACGIESITLSQTTFTCANIGDNTVTLIVTDLAGNIDSCSAIINVQPAAIIVAGQTTVCSGQTIPLTANAGDTYQWRRNGVDIPGATSQNFTASVSGDYTVVVTNAGGCSGESVPTTLTISTGSNVSISPANATITCGSPTILTAGNAALFQWQFNGVDIPGATV